MILVETELLHVNEAETKAKGKSVNAKDNAKGKGKGKSKTRKRQIEDLATDDAAVVDADEEGLLIQKI